MRRFLSRNALSLAMFGLFLTFLIGESIAGFHTYNEDQEQAHQPKIGYFHYLRTGEFWEAAIENWESEYLEMAMFLVLTAFLVQKGSAESHPPKEEAGKREEEREAKDSAGGERASPDAPWPVRRGGLVAWIYSWSLSLTLFALFLTCFLLHAHSGAIAHNHEQALQGHPTHYTTLTFIATSDFWFQSFQNWQSEFLGIASLTVLSIWLRQRGSPESKPVEAPSEQTGEG